MCTKYCKILGSSHMSKMPGQSPMSEMPGPSHMTMTMTMKVILLPWMTYIIAHVIYRQDWLKENRTVICMPTYHHMTRGTKASCTVQAWQYNLYIYDNVGKSLNLWPPISVVMKHECKECRKKRIKCECAKMVCTVDTQLTSAILLLMISLCSFRVNTLMKATLGSIYKGGYNKTRECKSRKKNNMKSHGYY